MNKPHCFIRAFHFYAKPGSFAFIGVVLANILFDCYIIPVILFLSVVRQCLKRTSKVLQCLRFYRGAAYRKLLCIDSFICFLLLLLPALSRTVAAPHSLEVNLEGTFCDAVLQCLT